MAVNVSGNLTNANLFSKSFANLFNLLSNKNNVVDPVFSNSTRTMVYARFPDINNIHSEGYPFFVILPADISNSEFNLAQDTSKHEFSFMIEIYCTDRIRGKEGKGNYSIGIQYVDELTDSIIKTLLNATNRIILNNYGLGTPRIETQSIDTIEINDDLVWIRRIFLDFKKRLRTG